MMFRNSNIFMLRRGFMTNRTRKTHHENKFMIKNGLFSKNNSLSTLSHVTGNPDTYKKNLLSSGFLMMANSKRNLSLWGWGSSNNSNNASQASSIDQLQSKETLVEKSPIDITSKDFGLSPENVNAMSSSSGSTNVVESVVGTVSEMKDVDIASLPKLSDTILDDNIASNILTSVQNFGDLKLLGLCANTPVGLIERLAEAIYLSTGLPWWGTIVAMTAFLRLLVLYPTIAGQRSTLNMARIRTELEDYRKQIKDAQSKGEHKLAKRKSEEMFQLMKENNVSFKANFAPFLQFPIFLSAFLAIRKMSELPVPGFENGGAYWFADLSVSDPYFALPAIAAAGTYVTIRASMKAAEDSGKPFSAAVQTGAIVAAPLMILVTYKFPMAVFIYWITANTLSIAQMQLLKNPYVRQFFNLPPPIRSEEITQRPTTTVKLAEPVSMSTAKKVLKELRLQQKQELEQHVSKHFKKA